MSEEIYSYHDESDEEENVLTHATMIPNLVDDMGLSVYAVRLYLRFKRRVRQLKNGETLGTAFDSMKTLARDCGMSAPTVTRAKRELVNAGLIRIEKVQREHGEFPSDHITIVNLWRANRTFYGEDLIAVGPDGQVYKGAEARKAMANDPKTQWNLVGILVDETAQSEE